MCVCVYARKMLYFGSESLCFCVWECVCLKVCMSVNISPDFIKKFKISNVQLGMRLHSKILKFILLKLSFFLSSIYPSSIYLSLLVRVINSINFKTKVSLKHTFFFKNLYLHSHLLSILQYILNRLILKLKFHGIFKIWFTLTLWIFSCFSFCSYI